MPLSSDVKIIEEISDQELNERCKRHIAIKATDPQKALLVLDQFDPDHWNDLQSLFDIGWQVLLISREKLPEGLCPSMNLEEMQAADLAGLFAHYAHQPLQEKADVKAFIALANAVYGHTLTMELIARQIAKSHLTLQEAAEMVDSAGFKALPTDQIDYLRDSKVMRATLTKVLDQLMAVDSFTDDDRLLVQELALFDLPGIDASLFRSLTGRAQLDHLTIWRKVAGSRSMSGSWLYIR